jgi:hypothetical protein
MRLLLGGVVAAGMILAAQAADFPVEEQVVAASEVAQSKQINDPLHGLGKQETKTWKFSVQIKNTGVDAIPPLEVKLYVVQVKNWIAPQSDQFKDESVLRVLEKKDVPVTDESVELGDVDISSMNSDAGGTKWYGGSKYAGYVLEVYQDGKLVDTKVGGGAPVRKAYEAFLKSPTRSGV